MLKGYHIKYDFFGVPQKDMVIMFGGNDKEVLDKFFQEIINAVNIKDIEIEVINV